MRAEDDGRGGHRDHTAAVAPGSGSPIGGAGGTAEVPLTRVGAPAGVPHRQCGEMEKPEARARLSGRYIKVSAPPF